MFPPPSCSDLLWESHPDIVERFCKAAPTLLCDLLDGHMWESDQVINGRRRVHFYVKELWGDPRLPSSGKNSYETPMALMVRNKDPALFIHPVMKYIVDAKWEKFARNRFLVLHGLYSVQVRS
jgi:hypothetical protein